MSYICHLKRDKALISLVNPWNILITLSIEMYFSSYCCLMLFYYLLRHSHHEKHDHHASHHHKNEVRLSYSIKYSYLAMAWSEFQLKNEKKKQFLQISYFKPRKLVKKGIITLIARLKELIHIKSHVFSLIFQPNFASFHKKKSLWAIIVYFIDCKNYLTLFYYCFSAFP